MLIDYHVHAMAHGEYECSVDWFQEYLNKARSCNISLLGFSEHDWLWSGMDLAVIRDLASKPENKDIGIRLGIEVDYKPERENEIKILLGKNALDYVIGSVHHIGEWPFDHTDYKDEFLHRDIDGVYQEYYRLVQQAVRSHLFDVVGHLDLVKVWGFRSSKFKDSSQLKALLGEIRRSGMVVEVNTGGLRKPIAEIYPSENILHSLFENNIPITFGSDAHYPHQLGEGLIDACRMAWNVGYRNMAGFLRRSKTWHLIENNSG
ncbi:MAG: histidinol-phosphatase HisJ family protein [Syntrophomonadaceae bacterium]|nr:histidinol-phosphatase HisJ family protein [Syntrophomonadaceae bacterium]